MFLCHLTSALGAVQPWLGRHGLLKMASQWYRQRPHNGTATSSHGELNTVNSVPGEMGKLP